MVFRELEGGLLASLVMRCVQFFEKMSWQTSTVTVLRVLHCVLRVLRSWVAQRLVVSRGGMMFMLCQIVHHCVAICAYFQSKDCDYW